MPTYPSELALPYVLNYDNAITSALLSAGTGIYFSDDNLVTVINYYDGSAGTPADITNNELGRVDNYRIGVDISGLSPAQQTSLTEDPYQLFNTSADERDQYVLSFDGVNDFLSFPNITWDSGTLEVEMVLSADSNTAKRDQKLLTFSGTNQALFLIGFNNINNPTTLRIFAQQENGNDDRLVGVMNVANREINTVKLTADRGTGDITVSVNGVIDTGLTVNSPDLAATTNSLVCNTAMEFQGAFNQFAVAKLSRLRVETPQTTERLWIFDRQGTPTTVADEYNGVIATLNNSPVFERAIEQITFTTNDYASLSLLNASENARSYEVVYDFSADITGDSISGFANGLQLLSTSQNSITTPLTFTTTGGVWIEGIVCDDIDASGASNVYINNCEAQDVTG